MNWISTIIGGALSPILDELGEMRKDIAERKQDLAITRQLLNLQLQVTTGALRETARREGLTEDQFNKLIATLYATFDEFDTRNL